MDTLELTLNVTTSSEELEDRWAVTATQFGFTVYGKTEKEAEANLVQGVGVLLNSFNSNTAALRKFLDEHGVTHRLSKVDGKSPPRQENRPPRLSTRELEVRLGAPV